MDDSTSSNEQKEDDLFYFESDHLALRGNKDYSELLKTLFILSAQRERAVKDYEKIQQMKKSALEDPGLFLENLKNDELGIPPLQAVAQIPYINWYAYNTKIPEEELKAIYSEKSNEKRGDSQGLEKVGNKNTHKQPWTPEEQKRLEELLVTFPPEAIELRRIKKIAAALGNRTVQQVSSRLQKYFLKLHKAGLHVPGRIPKAANFQRKNKHKHGIWKPTTFFPEYNVSVLMDETETAPGPSIPKDPQPVSTSVPNYLLPMVYHHPEAGDDGKTEKELQLELLKRIRTVKVKDSEMTEPYRHLTYKCDYCNEEPILGTRWHCSTCIQDSTDFCTDCLLTQLYSETPHPLSHKFVTLPHPDDPNFNMSSDSGSESENETSNNNEISDSDVSARSSFSSLKSTQFSSPNGNVPSSRERNGKNGLKKSSEAANLNDFQVDKFLNELMYADEKELNSFSTQDIGYSYLHSNLSRNN